MAQQQQPSDGSRPGVMGDWSEEQNLGQPGDPSARITKTEVEEAFDGDRKTADPQKDQAKPS